MKVLFDQGVPAPLRRHLSGHSVATAFELGWSQLRNGELLDAAESDGFEVFITTDQSLKHEQNLSGRLIAVVVLRSTAWPRIQLRVNDILSVVNNAGPGGYIEVVI